MRVIYHYARQWESLQSRVSGFFYSLPPRKQATELIFYSKLGYFDARRFLPDNNHSSNVRLFCCQTFTAGYEKLTVLKALC